MTRIGLQTLLLMLSALPSVPVWSAWFDDEQAIMGTVVKVSLWSQEQARGEAAVSAVMDEMRRIDRTLSPYIASSELAQVNARAAAEPVELSPELSYLLDKSLYYSRISHGAFDITFASLGWYYDYRQGLQPSAEQKQKLLPAVNYRLLEFDKQAHSLRFGHRDLRIDLGGIAKGHAIDRAVTIMREHGVTNATVSAGGDSRVLGDKMGRPWLIGIKNPRMRDSEDKEVVITLPLSDVAVSTSGDYERFFIDAHSGERIHHIINPKTGQSAAQVISVTVMGPMGVDTDALSTSVFVLGVAEGLKLINQMPEFDTVIIDRQGQVSYSDGLMPPQN